MFALFSPLHTSTAPIGPEQSKKKRIGTRSARPFPSATTRDCLELFFFAPSFSCIGRRWRWSLPPARPLAWKRDPNPERRATPSVAQACLPHIFFLLSHSSTDLRALVQKRLAFASFPTPPTTGLHGRAAKGEKKKRKEQGGLQGANLHCAALTTAASKLQVFTWKPIECRQSVGRGQTVAYRGRATEHRVAHKKLCRAV